MNISEVEFCTWVWEEKTNGNKKDWDNNKQKPNCWQLHQKKERKKGASSSEFKIQNGNSATGQLTQFTADGNSDNTRVSTVQRPIVSAVGQPIIWNRAAC